MDLKQLKTFIAVAESGSLSRASDRLHIVQPALSRHIKLLEHEVGVSLFSRHVRGMELTEEGKIFFDRVSGLVRQIEVSVHDLQSIHAEVKGSVVLGMTPSINTILAVRLLKRAFDEMPGITLRTIEGSSSHLLDWLHRGDIDIALLYQPSSELHLHTTELLSEEMMLASPPAMLADNRKTITLSDVARLPLAIPSQPDMYRVVIDLALKKQGLSLDKIYEVGSFWIMRELVTSGFCHSILPISSIHKETLDGSIEVRRITSPKLTRTIVLGSSNDRPNTRAIDTISSLVRSEIGTMVDSGEWPVIQADGLQN